MRSIIANCAVYRRSCGIFFALTWLMIAVSVQAATLPPIHNGDLSPPKLPTKILNCSLPAPTFNGISPSLGGFSNCVRGKITTYAERSATEATTGLQQQLNELQQSIEGMVPGDVQQCLSTAGNALSTSVNAARNNPTQFAQRHLNDVFSGLRDRAGTALNITLNLSQSPAERMQHFEQMLLAMISADPLAACVYRVNTNVRNQIIAIARTMAQSMEVQMQAWYRNQFEPQVYAVVQRHLASAFRGLQVQTRGTNTAFSNRVKGAKNALAPAAIRAKSTLQQIPPAAVPEEIRLLAKGMMFDLLLNPKQLNKMSSAVSGYASAKQSGAVSASQQKALLRTLQNGTSVADNLAIDLGVRVLRKYGHQIIRIKGEPLVGLGFEFIRGWKTTGGEALDIPCSTPSVPGGAVCGVVWWAANIVMDTALWGLEVAANKALHLAYDRFLDEYHASLRENGTPHEQLARHPKFGKLVAIMPSERQLVDLFLPELQAAVKALQGYNSAVGELATTSPIPATSKKAR